MSDQNDPRYRRAASAPVESDYRKWTDRERYQDKCREALVLRKRVTEARRELRKVVDDLRDIRAGILVHYNGMRALTMYEMAHVTREANTVAQDILRPDVPVFNRHLGSKPN